MASQDFVCRIPLKPTNEPPKEDEVRRLLLNPKFRLVDEFAVRYLESIGAAPTPANIQMVKKEIPVKRFKLKAAYKSRGGLEDMIYMEKVEPKNEGRHLWRNAQARSLFSEMIDKKLAATTLAPVQDTGKDKSRGLLGAAGKTERDSSRTAGLGGGLPKLNADSVQASNRPPPMSPSKRDDIASRVAMSRLATQSSLEQSRTARSRKVRRSQVGGPEFVEEANNTSELGIKVAMDDVLSIQTMFTRTFPLAHLRDRLPADELAILVGELTGIKMAQLILHLCQLCEWAIVHKCNPPPEHDLAGAKEESFAIPPLPPKGERGRSGGGAPAESGLAPAVEAVLMETFKGWIEMQGRISKRQHAVIAYPIYLMLIRVAVETVMRNAVPSIFKGPKNEVQVLEKTERIVSAMLDPDGYLNYPLPAPPGKAFIEALQPARPPPEGVPALNASSRPWAPLSGAQASKTPSSHRFYTVSPHVKTLLTASSCPQLSIFRHAQNPGPPQASHAGGKTPRGERAAGAGAAVGGGGAQGVDDFRDIFSKELSPAVLHSIYQLALKKREQLRRMGPGNRKNQQPEEGEDEALNSILPMGVEYLKRPTMAAGGAGGGAV